MAHSGSFADIFQRTPSFSPPPPPPNHLLQNSITLYQVSATYARHSERGPAEIIPEPRRHLPHNVQFILNCAKAIEPTPGGASTPFERKDAKHVRDVASRRGADWKGRRHLYLQSEENAARQSSIHLSAAFKRYPDAHLRRAHLPGADGGKKKKKKPFVVYRRARARTGWRAEVARRYAQLEAGAA